MHQSAEVLNKRKNLLNRLNNLVLSIDQNERIIKFNNECEQIFGYNKDEVLNSNLSDSLIPNRYQKQWKNMIKSIKKDKSMDDFKLPLLTKHGHEIMVSWASFPVKNQNGDVEDIGFVGKFINSWNDAESPIVKKSKINFKKLDIDDIDKTSKKLVKRNFELEHKNLELQEELKNYKSHKIRINESGKPHISPIGKSIYSISDMVGGKKKREEFERIMKELEDKRILLDERETQLTNEKRSMNERRNEFCTWREKLEFLEDELKKRADELNSKQEELKQAILTGSNKPINEIVTTEDIIDYPDFLNHLSESAIVLQRGILRQVNDSFLNLLGYNSGELLDKSIFDFVDPEGFQGVESYYLKRIKGENISTYETIFLTKDNYKITVELSNRPTTFNGDKAEIAVIKELKKEKIKNK
ncbi:MAG: PAS domain S-box protein [Thermoplasmatales archaeon]|nr:PAS domain S-box protein [Thermoplasmatales archaeon]